MIFLLKKKLKEKLELLNLKKKSFQQLKIYKTENNKFKEY